MQPAILATISVLFIYLIVQRGVLATGVCSPVPQSADIGDRATCPFTVTVDADPERIPAELPVMKCNCPDSLCSVAGDYRCQEVRSTFRVAFRAGGSSSQLTNKTLELPTSCVCVVARSASGQTGGTRPQGGDVSYNASRK
ncbi:hypothetical protein HPB49_013358 [Dermacentor silvarum]|uniref:Uncharacterized protein n=1 Tax=Dermacentor silvarum TaxID=543639 RepID=A0ACB8DP04_DERSI|nr:hypothetical protein HPB49_013358 [Dermacentor silvarum]